jgi:hypothetical protein
MFSNRKLYEGATIYNRSDFTESSSQLPSVTVVDSSGNSLNSNDFVLKTGDVITGLLQFNEDVKIIYGDGSIQEKAFTNSH